MVVFSFGRFIFARSDHPFLEKRFGYLVGIMPVKSHLEDQADIWSSFLVNLHFAIGSFLITIRTDNTLIFPALHFYIFGRSCFYRHIPAVKFTDQIFHRHADTASITLVLCAVKTVLNRDKADAEYREYTLHKVSHFNHVAPESGKIFYKDAVDLPCPYPVEQFLDSRTLKIGSAVSVVDKFFHLSIWDPFHIIRIVVKQGKLAPDAQAVYL